MFHRILVPLDGSVASEAALPHSLAIADSYDCELCLVRVVQPGRAGGIRHDAVEWRLDRANAERYLERWVQLLSDEGRRVVVGHVAEGVPAEEIIRCAKLYRAGLVVLTTHGRHEAVDFRLGGTARKVISLAGVSVSLARATSASAQKEGEKAVYRRILVPTDCSPRSEWALRLAASFARVEGAELLLLHVVPVRGIIHRTPIEPSDVKLQEDIVAVNRRAAEQYLEEVRSELASPELHIRSRILESDHVPQTLHEAVSDWGADLIIVSAHGLSGMARWPYGSVAANLISYADAPLLVLQDQSAQATGENIDHSHGVGRRMMDAGVTPVEARPAPIERRPDPPRHPISAGHWLLSSSPGW